jgi:glutamine synthetase type III
MRNSLNAAYQANLYEGFKQSNEHYANNFETALFPYISDTSCSIKYKSIEEMDQNWIGREYSAAVNYVQTLSERFYSNINQEVELTAALIRKMTKLCQAKEVNFSVICLDQTNETKALKMLIGTTPWHEVDFNFENRNLTNYPYDSHPNAKGHLKIAEKILPFILE